MADIQEFNHGNVSDLPDVSYFADLDIRDIVRQSIISGSPYDSLSVFDLPDNPDVLVRSCRAGALVEDKAQVMTTALQHFAVLERLGLSVPDTRFFVVPHVEPHSAFSEYHDVYAFTRRVQGQTLDKVTQNQAHFVSRLTDMLGEYFLWALNSGETEDVFPDHTRTVNFMISDPTDRNATIWAHDVDPQVVPVREDETYSTDMRCSVAEVFELSRGVPFKLRPRSIRKALRIVEPLPYRVVRAVVGPMYREKFKE